MQRWRQLLANYPCNRGSSQRSTFQKPSGMLDDDDVLHTSKHMHWPYCQSQHAACMHVLVLLLLVLLLSVCRYTVRDSKGQTGVGTVAVNLGR